MNRLTAARISDPNNVDRDENQTKSDSSDADEQTDDLNDENENEQLNQQPRS